MASEKRPLPCPHTPQRKIKHARIVSVESLPDTSVLLKDQDEDYEEVSFARSSPRTSLVATDLYDFAVTLERADCIFCRWTGSCRVPDHSVDECTKKPADFIADEARMQGKCLCGGKHPNGPCALMRIATTVAGVAMIVDDLREDFSFFITDEWADVDSYKVWCFGESKWRSETVANVLIVLHFTHLLALDEPKWRSKWLPELGSE